MTVYVDELISVWKRSSFDIPDEMDLETFAEEVETDPGVLWDKYDDCYVDTEYLCETEDSYPTINGEPTTEIYDEHFNVIKSF